MEPLLLFEQIERENIWCLLTLVEAAVFQSHTDGYLVHYNPWTGPGTGNNWVILLCLFQKHLDLKDYSVRRLSSNICKVSHRAFDRGQSPQIKCRTRTSTFTLTLQTEWELSQLHHKGSHVFGQASPPKQKQNINPKWSGPLRLISLCHRAFDMMTSPKIPP